MRYEINPSDSINEVLKKLKDNDELYLNPGVYKEKVEFFNNNIRIYGSDKNTTKIANNDFFHKIMPDFNECNTFRTYTVYVGGDNVTIEGITIENSCFDSDKYGQAVALHVDGTNFHLLNSRLTSSQDTLFTGPLPPDLIERHQGFLPQSHLTGKKTVQIYESSEILGNVDFIFGSAYALFINCDIIVHNDSKRSHCYLSAPSHAKDDKYGYLFYHCNLLAQINSNEVYLSRPWRDYGTCAFIECKLGNFISPLGWNKWDKTERDKTARFYEYTEGFDLSKREPWVNILSKDEASKYVSDFFEFIGYKK